MRLSFEGKGVQLCPGDTIASALHRAGVRTFSRSFKYHRRRGLYCLTGDCPNCLCTLNGEPAVRACTTPALDRQRVKRDNAWPSADLDLLKVAWHLRRLMPVGWYYKVMTRPAVWRFCEPFIRKVAGLGKVRLDLPAEDRVAAHVHPDLCVVGGGAAGLSAALAAARAGQTVLLADEGAFGDKIPPGRVSTKVAQLVAALRQQPGVTLLERATAIGLYEGPLVPIAARERTWLVHPQRVVVATGVVEEHAVFPGSDLPGVWLGRGAARMAGVHGERPGHLAVVACRTHEGPAHVEALLVAGTAIAAVVTPGDLANGYPSGIRTIKDGALLGAEGTKQVEAAVVDTGRGREAIACDALVISLGFQPRAGLLRQAVSEPVVGAGEVVAPGCSLEAAVASGEAAARGSTDELNYDDGPLTVDSTAAQKSDAGVLPVACADGFVCLCEDVTTTELQAAWAEGYQSTELLKRYTTATMGPCQGAMCHAHLRAFVNARLPKQPFAKPTTARPPARPVRVQDAAAGLRYVVEHRTALHQRHLEMGAGMGWFGAWKRPVHYGDERAEYDAVRHGVSIMDVGTLGKFLVTGPDATEFLERLYPCHVGTIAQGRLRYALLLNEAGYIFDDGLICPVGPDRYCITFTTAGAEQGEGWLKDWAETWGLRVHIVNRTAAFGAINLTGPKSRQLLAQLCSDPIGAAQLPFATHRKIRVAGIECRALRLGFVGELGFELHHPSGRSVELWEALLAAGEPMGLMPHGVDPLLLLRLEKGHIVIGMDTDFDSTPAKVGMGWAVNMDKDYFVGKTALERLADIELDKKLVGVVFDGNSAPRQGTALTCGGEYAGYLSSSGYSPVLAQGIGLAWLRRRDGEFPRAVAAEGRPGRVTSLPFYDPQGARVRG